MTDIQRYEVLSGGFIVEQSYGSLVDYDDHAAIVAALEKQVQKLESRESRVSKLVTDNEKAWQTLCLRLEAAEAELARRDEAAGEPYGYVHKGVYEMAGSAGLSSDSEREGCPSYIPLYTASQPSALPPEIDIVVSEPTEWNRGMVKGYNQAIADAKALGCKAIKLPEHTNEGVGVTWEDGFSFGVQQCVTALKAQGFTVEGE